MRTPFFPFALALCLSAALFAGEGRLLAQRQEERHCLPVDYGNLPYRPGEALDFALVYNWGSMNTEIASAHINLSAERFDGKPAYHVHLTARTAPFFDVFFKMRENFHSWFTVDGLRPLKFTRDSREGSYHVTNLTVYDWDALLAHTDMQVNGGEVSHIEVPLHACVYDLPALVYYLRAVDLSRLVPGRPYDLTFVIDEGVFNIHFTFIGPEKVSLRGKRKLDALHFSCSVVSGVMFSGDTNLEVWFSDDANHVPLQFMAPLRTGSMYGRLKGAEQLKTPIF